MQLLNTQEIENAMEKYGDVVLCKNSKNNVVVLSIEEYKNKLQKDEIEKKLLEAEEQIDEEKTVKATDVFKELEEKYEF